MDINRMREFCYLADTLSFSETAKHFFLSQSVLSKHIANMEDQLGAKLLERTSHYVRLTEQGQVFREDAQEIISRYDRALMRIADVNDSFEATVSVGYLRNASRPFISRFAAAMARDYPKIHLVLRCMEFGDLMYAFEINSVDIAITLGFVPGADSKHRCQSIYRDYFDVIVAKNHPLAGFDEITSDQLRDVKLMLPDEETYGDMRRFVNGMLPEGALGAGCEVYRDVDTLFLRVSTEGFAGFSSEHNKFMFEDKVKFLPIADKPTAYDVCAYVHKDSESEATQVCFDELAKCHDYLARNGGGSGTV